MRCSPMRPSEFQLCKQAVFFVIPGFYGVKKAVIQIQGVFAELEKSLLVKMRGREGLE